MAITRINNNQITDASAGNIYLGVNASSKLQDFSITAGKIQNNLTYGSDLTITGNLTVNGNTTTIDTINLVVEDPLILLAKEQTGSPALDIGFIGKRGTEDNIAWVWDESADEFVAAFTTSEVTNTVITINSYASARFLDLTAANANITGNLTFNGSIIGNVDVTGNITGGNLISDAAIEGVTITASGNLVGGNANISGAVNSTTVVATGNVTGGNLNTAGQVVATGNVSGGNVTTAGQVVATGNVSGGNLNTAGQVVATGNVSGGNVTTAGQVVATGNVSGGNVTTAGNVDSANVNATGTVIATGNVSGGNVTTAGQVVATGNVSGGNITTAGQVVATGNVSGGNVITAGNVDGANINASAGIAAGTTVIATGNVTGGNVTTAGQVAATGNVSGGNITTGGVVAATGNVAGGNITTAGNVDGANVNATTAVSAVTVIASGNVNGGNINSNSIVGTDIVITAASVDMNLTGNLIMSGRFINSVADPVLAQDAATKQYVDDAVSTGIHIHTPVDVETPSALPAATYANGGNTFTVNETIAGNTVVFTSAANLQVNDQLWFDNSFNGVVGNLAYFVVSTPNASAAVLSTTYNGEPVSNITSGSGLTESVRVNSGVGATLTANSNGALTVDGFAVSAGNRVLVYNQSSAIQNGVYDVTDAGNVSAPWILTRSSDADTYEPDTSTGLDQGSYFYVKFGDTGAGESYVKTAPAGPFIFGVANIVFTQFSSSQVYSANTAAGLVLNGTVFSAKVDNETTAFISGNIAVKTNANLVTPNIGNATGNSLTLSGNGLLSATTVSATGNVSGGNLVTAGDVTTVTVTASGNISGANVNASAGITAGTTVIATGNVTGGNVTTAGQVVATGNVTGGNLNTAGQVVATGNVSGGNVTTAGTVVATGNVDGANVNASAGITAGTTVIATGNVSGGNITTAGQVTATGNVAGGNVTTAGQVTATGNVSGGNITTAGNVDGANVNASAGITAGTTVIATGNVSGGNVTTAGQVTATGNVSGGNITTGGVVTATGNVSGGNVTTAGQVTATGNVTGGNLITTGAADLGNIRITGNDITNPASNIITINAAGSDIDLRVSGDNETNLFIVDAGSDTVLIGTATATTGAALKVGTTDSIMIPVGNISQRPATGVPGMLRFNTTTDSLEYYDNDSWTSAGTTFTIIVADEFNGDGSTVAFTLSEDSTTAGTIVSINGVVQIPTTAYAVSGNVLTFTEAPAVSDVIDARILTTTQQVVGITNASGNAIFEGSATARAFDVTGNLIPTANVTFDLGSSSLRWRDGYFAGNSITLGNIVMKNTGGNSIGFFGPDGTTPATLDANVEVVGDAIESGTSNVSFAGSNGNVLLIAGGNTTGVITATGANVAGYITATGNVTGGNLITGAQVVATGNVSGGNLTTAGLISATGNVTGGNLITAGLVSLSSITKTGSNGVGNIGSSTSVFNTVFAKATSAQYADLAEMYEADALYEPGTVVCFGGTREVTACVHDNDRRVAGVVSTNPSYLMNSAQSGEYVVPVALTGRVPCRVTGKIRKGDLMVSAGDGSAMANNDAAVGTVIGKALQDFDSGQGTIEVVVGRF